MSIQSEIYNRLNHSTVTNYTNDRIYATDPSVNTDQPFIVYRAAADTPDVSLSGATGLRLYSVTVDVWADNLDNQTGLSTAVSDRLHVYQGGNIQGSWLSDLSSEIIGDGTEGDIYHALLTFSVWYSGVEIATTIDATGTVQTGLNSVTLTACDHTLTLDCDGLQLDGEPVGSGSGTITTSTPTDLTGVLQGDGSTIYAGHTITTPDGTGDGGDGTDFVITTGTGAYGTNAGPNAGLGGNGGNIILNVGDWGEGESDVGERGYIVVNFPGRDPVYFSDASWVNLESVTGNTITATLFFGSGAGITSLNGSQVTTGTVAAARLGSGTANSTTYLRGNNTWGTPPATAPGGGDDNVQFRDASGNFAGSSSFRYFASTNTLNVGTINGAAWKPASLDETAAPNDTIFRSTNTGRISYKDAAGTVTAFY